MTSFQSPANEEVGALEGLVPGLAPKAAVSEARAIMSATQNLPRPQTKSPEPSILVPSSST